MSNKENSPDYVFFDRTNAASRAKAEALMSSNAIEFEKETNSVHASISGRRSYTNIDTKTSIRPSFTRKDYEYFRPEEAVPTAPKDIIVACDYAYERIGILNQIINLMSDFACQGIQIQHSNPKNERFFKAWFEKVKGKAVSSQFLNCFYGLGNVFVRRKTGKITPTNTKQLEKVKADPEVEIDLKVNNQKREIPWQYVFLNPASIDVLNENMCCFTGEYQYVLNIDVNLARMAMNPQSDIERRVAQEITDDVMAAINKGVYRIPLDMDKIRVFYYKKKDWEAWSKPMSYSVLDDLILLEKIKLADLAALEGAISHVRVWKLGSLEHELIPAPGAANRLARILENNTGSGPTDVIWGPDLELVESKSNIYQFLGEEKYKATLTNIYAGLGVPPTLTGSSTQSGFTNNYISLKTLIEKLQYGRDALLNFWNYEIELVQKAMGYRKPAFVRFERMTLADESAEKKLLMDLMDRNIVSSETVLERFGEMYRLEEARLIRETRKQKRDGYPQRSSSLPVFENDLKKAFISTGTVTPSEVGVELQPKKPGEKSTMDHQAKQTMDQHKVSMEQFDKQHQMQNDKLDKDTKLQQVKLNQLKVKQKGIPGQGRPKNQKDSTKRKTKTVKPRTSASIDKLLNEYPQEVIDILKPYLLEHLSGYTNAQIKEVVKRCIENYNICPKNGLTNEYIQI